MYKTSSIQPSILGYALEYRKDDAMLICGLVTLFLDLMPPVF